MELKMLAIEQLKTGGFSPRSTADGDHFSELKESIKAKGVLFPLVAAVSGKGYAVLDGNRRLKSCKSLGWKSDQKLPVLVIKADAGQAVEAALVANAVRENADALGESETVNLLINKYGRVVKDVAGLLGKSEVYIRRLLKIYTLPAKVLSAVRQSEISLAHAHWLTKLIDKPAKLDSVFKKAVKDKLTYRDVETLVSGLLNQSDGYHYFSPRVVTTKAGSRLRFEARRHSVRVELNLNLDEPVEAVLAEVKKHLDELKPKRLKAVG